MDQLNSWSILRCLSINMIGVKIQITGPTPKTQTNNFVFTGLAAGNYTYTVTYGDENNPDCIKTGSFIIELSREPDPVDFDLTVNEFDCDANKGSITLTNIIGASSVDFQYTVLANGSIWDQSAISSSSTSFTVSNLLLGDYEVQLSQNQEAVNGCVGIVSSSLVPLQSQSLQEDAVYLSPMFLRQMGMDQMIFLRSETFLQIQVFQ